MVMQGSLMSTLLADVCTNMRGVSSRCAQAKAITSNFSMSGRETYRSLAPRSAFLETMPTSKVSGDQFFPHTPYDPAASA
eukprot:CAMPEP_0198701672 /NCGR_PEP_ID=MMETSP1468-20131203/388325_1 /TAXON_ID=1461545 /ORGANISM="Mantoniella sp, Strain CCMP1436" /LENGTH=79 /DNA_ID=CAMNT_0044460099 /DNA_START=18 /DNA_END=254 /DNA_ORIENTATION=-